MLNPKRHFIIRSILILLVAALFFSFVWYNENRDRPDFIEKKESFFLEHIYGTEDGFLSEYGLKETADSLNRIFHLPVISQNTALVSITAGDRHNLIFSYQYTVNVDAEGEKAKLEEYRRIQLLRFCNNPLDARRLEVVRSYDFVYTLAAAPVISFSVTGDDCRRFGGVSD
ncbi:MAG: hypothetical protein IJ523_08320 [Succinivibrionaceae bacterium]|nr:hypothetical protein [Succinivibrionaceae bacterium]